MIEFYGTQLRAIRKFKCLLSQYYKSDEISNSDRNDIRSNINMLKPSIRKYIIDAELPLTASQYKHVGTGEEIDIIGNIFQIERLRGTKSLIIDLLDMTYGFYNEKHSKSLRRLLNPFFLIGEFIRLPFHIGKFAGFNKIDKIEFSIIGKLWKLFLGLVFFFAAIATILSFILAILNELDINLKDFLGL